MPASVCGMVVTRGDLSWDTEPFRIWSLVQIRTSLAEIESPYHLVTQMNSSRWTGALITVGALIDWGAKSEWEFQHREVWVPCFADVLWMENFNSSALLMCYIAQTMGTSMLKGKAITCMWEWTYSCPGSLPTLAILVQPCCFTGYQRAVRPLGASFLTGSPSPCT